MAEVMTRKDNMRLHELQVRVNMAIPLGATLTDTFAIPEPLERFVETFADASPQYIPEPFRDFFKFAEEYEIELDDPSQSGDCLKDYVLNRGLYGWLVQASKPVKNSWGNTYETWFYGATWSEALAQVEAWKPGRG